MYSRKLSVSIYISARVYEHTPTAVVVIQVHKKLANVVDFAVHVQRLFD